jgi:transcriptional regulator with XRE-family HTH domain
MSIQAAFGLALRELRTEREMSQEALALEADLNRGYYNGVELGKRNIALVNIEKIARALDLPVSVIFARVEKLRGSS